MNRLLTSVTVVALVLIAGCNKNEIATENSGALSLKKGTFTSSQAVSTTVPLGSASTFAVLGGTTVTNSGASLITGDAGVSPGTALTGFQRKPANRIEGPGKVTVGLGLVTGTIYAGGTEAAQAHVDAELAYHSLMAEVPVPDDVYSGVTQLAGMTFTPGVYSFASANLQVGGTLYLDFQGNSDAQFIFQVGTTLVTMTNSNVVALRPGTSTCVGSNVYWAVGTSATIDGNSFIGTVIANTTITMTNTGNVSGATNVTGRMLALNGAVTMVKSIISICGTSDGGTNPPDPSEICRDFVTGGGWIWIKDKATFGVSGGRKNGKYWGQLSFNDHKGVKVKSTSVTGYIYIDAVTRQIEGTARLNGKTPVTYTVIVTDNGEPGREDFFSIELSNEYSASGTLKGGNIQLHRICGEEHPHGDKEDFKDKDEEKGHKDCDD